MAKKTKKTATKKPAKKAKSNKISLVRPVSPDRLLRNHVIYLLTGGGAHAHFGEPPAPLTAPTLSPASTRNP